MALIKCKNCNNLVSDRSGTCPRCGATLEIPEPATAQNLPNDTETQKEPLSVSSLRTNRIVRSSVIALAIVAALLIIATLTCPSDDRHADKITDVFMEVMEHISSEYDFAQTQTPDHETFKQMVVEPVLKVDNYSIFSLGKFPDGDDYSTMTIGAFGVVVPLISASTIEENIYGSSQQDPAFPTPEE